MSDFASLLNQLDKSAKQPTTKSTSRDHSDDNDKKKRPQMSKNDSRKRPRTSSKPSDASQLSIQLSFVCVGAQKAGTSWLHEMLRKIPVLGLPQQKEVHFWDWNRNKGLGWYSRQFPRGNSSLIYGEITPCYVALSERDVQEIHALFPDLRVVFIARDLTDRAWSALTMELRNNVFGRTAGQFTGNDAKDMDSVTRNRMEKESDPNQQTNEYFMNRLQHSTHTQRSDYANAGLRTWLRYFGPEQILIINYEDISKNPKAVIEKVLEHIGVNSDLVNELSMEDLQKRYNVATKPRPIRPSLRKEMEAYLKPYAKEFNKLLQELGYNWKLDEYEK